MTKEEIAERKPVWHIVETDNFGGDYPDESFVAMNISDKLMAYKMARALNTSDDQARYYKVEPDGYVLVPGFKP